jgi:hypothetical protein
MTYCTYSHSAPNGKIFYIGKGNAYRPYAFSDRSQDWKRAVMKHGGVQIQVLAKWETEEEAFEHEKFLIACFDDLKFDLVNKTKGGRGPYGIKLSDESKLKKSLQMKGYVHKTVTCPNCGKSGGETSMKRWHFEKCSGTHEVRARVTVEGKRVHLGRFSTQQEADDAMALAYKNLRS